MATTSTSTDMNLRNPLPLSATQEAQVKQLYYKRVRGHCSAEIKGVHLLHAARMSNETFSRSFFIAKPGLV
jgi:hypothetical protein